MLDLWRIHNCTCISCLRLLTENDDVSTNNELLLHVTVSVFAVSEHLGEYLMRFLAINIDCSVARIDSQPNDVILQHLSRTVYCTKLLTIL